MRHLIYLLLVFIGPAKAAAEGLTAKDLVALERVSKPALSPDGKSVAYAVRTTDLAADKGRTSIWIAPVVGDAEPRQLTSDANSAHSPKWSSDGQSLYFLASRGETQQLWRLPMSGGEARQVTDYPVDIETYHLSPTGDRVAFSARVFEDCVLLRCTYERLAEKDRQQTSAQVYEKLLVRHWDVWDDGLISRIFTAPLNAGSAGSPVLVTKGVLGNVPSRPFGGAEDYTFSVDGKSLFLSARVADKKEAWSTNFDIYQVAASGRGKAKNLTASNKAWDAHPVVSPDGRSLAYVAMERPGFEADRFQVMLRDLRSGKTQALTADFDRSIGDLAFTSDSSALLLLGNDTGRRLLWRQDIKSGERTPLTSKGYVASMSSVDDQVVYAWDSLGRPADLYVQPLSGAPGRRLTAHNRDALARIQMGEYEQFSFAGWNEETVYGYVMKPADYRRGKRYPVAFLIHGGPQGSFGDHFHYRWNPQTYAAEGFAAVFIDFHGSTGYGQAFTDSITDDWGGKPLEDLQKGLDFALKKYPFLDGENICALGASYGGYMVNWIAGNWADRFKCLVNHDGVFDNRSMYYETEELWFPEWEHDGPYFENPDAHEKQNPANYVKQWQAPMLVIHGELDYRVPITQGLATFTALQRQGVESRLVYFPDENHWILKPNNSIRWHQEVMGWLHRWLD